MDELNMHLTPDELDLWLEGRLASHRTSHLETCDECRAAGEETREVVLRLSSLPRVAPPAGFGSQVMARLAAGGGVGVHLTADEMDDWVTGTLAAPRRGHLLGCAECRALADQERLVALRLEHLPLFNPGAGFADRVLAQVDLPVTSLVGAYRQWHRRTFANPVSTGVAAGIATVIGGSLAASVAWAAGNQELITGAGHWMLAHGRETVLSAAGAAGNFITAQAWYGPVRAALTPGRLAVGASALVALYAAGIVALRRLIALPADQVARAS